MFDYIFIDDEKDCYARKLNMILHMLAICEHDMVHIKGYEKLMEALTEAEESIRIESHNYIGKLYSTN